LLSKGAEKGHKIVIGNQANTSQIAMVFACAELGLNIVIIGNPLPPTVKIEDYVYGSINTKLRLMLPIDFFITESKSETDKFQLFKDICKSTIIVDEEILDPTPNNTIQADENTTLITCTSSGTTGQQVSRIYLDKNTSKLQTLALSKACSRLCSRFQFHLHYCPAIS
jgi:hypothetical protein